MKAIIMAGGEGSRLRPLTCDRPKPLTPVLNRPVMEHIIKLLKKHGIREIGVTLQYLPEAIMDYFGDGSALGVSLQYFIEETPLGTAGSVKNAGNFLDQTFLVISGDALTDFDLTSAIQFHRAKEAAATLVLTRVEAPLEYGVVLTNPAGSIQRFLEKPSWGEVFSDTVNTGIYVLEPEVLELFPAGKKFDFSQDLFPRLLKEKMPLYGCILPGYWCDIGNLQQYQQAHYDILAGKVQMDIPAQMIRPGIWVEEAAEIHPEAELEGPLYLGEGCKIGQGSKVGSYSILGSHVLVDGASLKKAIIWEYSTVGKGAQIRGAVLCNRVQVKSGGSVFEGAVIGDDTLIKEQGVVKSLVKVWPHKIIETGAILNDSLIWGTRCAKKVYGTEGVRGEANQEISPEFAAKIAAAFGMTLPRGGQVVVSRDDHRVSAMLSKAVEAGLLSVGIQPLEGGQAPLPLARFMIADNYVNGGIYLRFDQPDEMTMIFLDGQGANISKTHERKVENNLAKEEIRRVKTDQLLESTRINLDLKNYLNHVTKGYKPKPDAKEKMIVLAYPGQLLEPVISPLLKQMKFRWIEATQQTIKETAALMLNSGAPIGALLDRTGQKLVLIDETGRIISEDTLQALFNMMIMKAEPDRTVAVPVTAPGVMEQLAERYQGKVVRTQTALQSLMEKMLHHPGTVSQFACYFDGIYGLARILEQLAEGVTLAALVDELPQFNLAQKTIDCPWESKGKVMRKLMEENYGGPLELIDGIKIHHDQGWALVLPDSDEAVCRVYGEGINMEIAESLTDMYVDKINGMLHAPGNNC